MELLHQSNPSTPSQSFRHYFPRLQYITQRPQAGDYSPTKEWLVFITAQFSATPSVSQIQQLLQPMFAASPYAPNCLAIADQYPAYEFGCSSSFEVFSPNPGEASSRGDGNGSGLAYTDIALVCLPGIGRLRLRRTPGIAQANLAEVASGLFVSFNRTYRLLCSERQAQHLFNLKVYVPSSGDVIPWLPIVRCLGTPGCAHADSILIYKLSSLTKPTEREPIPYALQFMIDDPSPGSRPQKNLEDLLARVNSLCDCPDTRNRFPAETRFFGQYKMPGLPSSVCMGYVELATFAYAEGGKVEIKVWESQVWCGQNWTWNE